MLRSHLTSVTARNRSAGRRLPLRHGDRHTSVLTLRAAGPYLPPSNTLVLTEPQRIELDGHLQAAVLHADALIAFRPLGDDFGFCALRDELYAARDRKLAISGDAGKLLDLLNDVANEWSGLSMLAVDASFFERRQRISVLRSIGNALRLLSAVGKSASSSASRR